MCGLLEIPLVLLLLSNVQGSNAQSEESSCYYGPGSIAVTVIVTIILTTLLLCVFYLIWKRHWIKKKGKHLVLETDPEKGKEEYAYDNAAFGEVTSTPFQKVTEKTLKADATKSKWSPWSPLGVLIPKNEKPKTLDDSVLQEFQACEIKTVSLKSRDFTGLGFNIYGNMRDGIFIKDILHRGPASESGKLNSGDRIKSITINFEHVVYEDALTILSYASPYEVVLEAQGGKVCSATNQMPVKMAVLGHPLYRSSSTTDLIHIQKTAKQRLFPADDAGVVPSPYSSLQKTRMSNVPTLERHRSKSPKLDTSTQNPQQLKTQLEQKIFHNHKQQLKTKDERPHPPEVEIAATQKMENKHQRFGIKVLPVDPRAEPTREQTSPKSAELSQNDNNINLERHFDKLKVSSITTDKVRSAEETGTDEVDILRRKSATATPPPVKKRERNGKNEDSTNAVRAGVAGNDHVLKGETFIRNSLNGSGIKRDKDGIPQEIPSHMMNAAVAARRNRKGSVENTPTAEDVKSPKKQKGRAPAPPEDKLKTPSALNSMQISDNLQETDGSIATETGEISGIKKDYTSDSDVETDHRSSVNTIELNASDITIHQTEDTEDIQNRRTASTGDLTKIQKTRKISTGTLERAQSLDITDTTIPPLNKKRKGGSIEENLDSKSGSDESLYGKAKEPRLSLALDGLNTFQRNRLKKSTEWGNMEDAIVNLSKDEPDPGVMRVNNENVATVKSEEEQTAFRSPLFNKVSSETIPFESRSQWYQLGNPDAATVNGGADQPNCKNFENSVENRNGDQKTTKTDKLTSISFLKIDPHHSFTTIDPNTTDDSVESSHIQQVSPTRPAQTSIILLPNSARASESFLHSERRACGTDSYYNLSNKMYDTNVSDDMKVSRHSLGSLETADSFIHLNASSSGNISNIIIGEKTIADDSTFILQPDQKRDPQEQEEELYTTAIDATLANGSLTHIGNNENTFGFEKVSVASPNLVKNNVSVTETFHDVNDMITVEGPTSLTFEIHDDGRSSLNEVKNKQILNSSFQITPPVAAARDDPSTKSNFSLTYITEIQVLTPNNDTDVTQSLQSNVNPEIYDESRQNFESNIIQFESHIQSANNLRNFPANEKVDPEKELHKIQEIAEEQLKKLPEMRFSTSSYEGSKPAENCSSQIDQLRSNFEKSPAKVPPKGDGTSATKSRIPVATSKTPPTSPERRDSRNFDLEVDKEIVAIMSSPVHSTPISSNIKYQPKIANKNVSITSIRTNSKIPAGLPNRPPVPPRKYENTDGESHNRFSSNGNFDSSFKQWVFNPSDTITNLTVTENKPEQK